MACVRRRSRMPCAADERGGASAGCAEARGRVGVGGRRAARDVASDPPLSPPPFLREVAKAGGG